MQPAIEAEPVAFLGRADPALRSSTVIAAAGIRRVFRGRCALHDVSLDVATREIHALLGPNGAGKTTLLRIIAGLTAPSEGYLEVLGSDVSATSRELRSLIGVVPASERSFYLRISALENLVFFARLHGLRRREAEVRARELLERVGLGGREAVRVGEYSQGMQKRLAIARALLPRPRVLLVDEATHDLDPSGAHAIRRLVDELRRDGAAVVWATQRVEEIQGFAERVTVLQEGRVRFQGDVADLVARGSAVRYVVEVATRDGSSVPLRAAADALGSRATISRFGSGRSDRFVLALSEPGRLGAALACLIDAGIDVLSCQQERSGVEHGFLVVTGEAS
jgi:ABC-2 type transport system ATP-binding protein